MSDRERSTSLGTVIAFGFIILGILNLFALLNYKKAPPISSRWMPAALFIATGLIILAVKAMKKTGNR
jgi:lipopolysaccharide export LptBFGC system permease protein LptF